MNERERFSVWIVGGDAKKDQIMHDADMFESFKALIDLQPIIYDVTLEEGRTVEGVFPKFVKLIQSHKEYRAICIFIPGTSHIWKDETVKVVSDGKSWVMFDEYLKSLVIETPAIKA